MCRYSVLPIINSNKCHGRVSVTVNDRKIMIPNYFRIEIIVGDIQTEGCSAPSHFLIATCMSTKNDELTFEN